MKVIHDLVGYNGMKIVQNSDWFSFSLDSVLLANFVSVRPRDKEFLDLCCGNAPIPLILSCRTNKHLTGIEIQKDVYELALKSVQINKKNEQISLYNDDMMNALDYLKTNFYDIITMNPPYFKALESSVVNEDIHKTIARHEVKMNLEGVLPIIYQLLKTNGLFAMVHRTDRLIEIINLLQRNHLEPKRIQFIYPKESQNSNLFLIEASKNGKIGVKLLPPLYVHKNDGSYREEILELFQKR